jgi:hypothetical protein
VLLRDRQSYLLPHALIASTISRFVCQKNANAIGGSDTDRPLLSLPLSASGVLVCLFRCSDDCDYCGARSESEGGGVGVPAIRSLFVVSAMSTVLLPISIALVPSHKLNIYIPLTHPYL